MAVISLNTNDQYPWQAPCREKGVPNQGYVYSCGSKCCYLLTTAAMQMETWNAVEPLQQSVEYLSLRQQH